MNKGIEFISGKEYRLQDFFSGDNKIVIPDLQRDYCWGDKAVVGKEQRELVTDFVKNLWEQFIKSPNEIQTMGLIYGYEQPKHYLQICDGQQRLTTLFLIIGYLNTILPDGCFGDNIMSSKEREDDFEPYLQYSIRESTLYFLSDLSKNVFIERNSSTDGIKNSSWYFQEYEQDASIQSMISALGHIHTFIETLNSNAETLKSFGAYILDKLHLLYYDMGSRTNGEETYVVINTTGEPLSSSENLKPILIQNPKLSSLEVSKYSSQWEQREEWFWNRRGSDKTADNSIAQFFLWYWQIGLLQEKRRVDDKTYDLNPRDLFLFCPKEQEEEMSIRQRWQKFAELDNVQLYFESLKFLVSECNKNDKFKKVLKSIKDRPLENESDILSWFKGSELHIILPLIALASKDDNRSQLYPFLRKLRRNHFDLLWGGNGEHINYRGARYVDWRHIIQLIEQCPTNILLTAKLEDYNITHKVKTGIWFDEDERIKTILAEGGHQEYIESYEDNDYLMGDLTPLWGLIDEKEKISYGAFSHIWDNYNILYTSIKTPYKCQNASVANWFRLYNVVCDVNKISHIPYTAWNIEGCYFSIIYDTPEWINNPFVKKLLLSDNIIVDIKNIVRDKLKDSIYSPDSHKRFLKSWLLLKTLVAEKNNVLIGNYDRAISSYTRITDNYIDKSVSDFHWGNVICGYAWKGSGSVPATEKQYWDDKNNLDSPISDIEFISALYTKDNVSLSSEVISNGDASIHKLISDFLSEN